ncbi:hypothetical protein MCEMIEM12_01729 [Burkholderiaceae bacterium]
MLKIGSGMAAYGDGTINRCRVNRHYGSRVADFLSQDISSTYFIIMMVISKKTVRH